MRSCQWIEGFVYGHWGSTKLHIQLKIKKKILKQKPLYAKNTALLGLARINIDPAIYGLRPCATVCTYS